MTIPLVILAVCSLSAGWLSWPQSLAGRARFEKFLDPVFAQEAQVLQAEGKAKPPVAAEREQARTSPVEYVLMALSLAAAFIGAGMAWQAYGEAGEDYPEPIAVKAPAFYGLLYHKYYVDEGYDYFFTGRRKLGTIRLGVMGLGEGSSWFDSRVIDGTVNGAGSITRLTAAFSGWWDKWIIDGIGVNGPAILARTLSYPARLLQWGLVQWYALVMVFGLLGFAFYYTWR